MSMKDRIESSLVLGLEPVKIEVVDESDRHQGHSGAREGGETHYRVYIVSERFAGKPKIERHRMVYALLKDELAGGVHALALQTLAPGES
jgi:BolA protein